MIKFFRRIRQQLLSQNRFSKYLIYAIGEIVLVVIGILIALSINNWNEGRKQKNTEIIYLKGLKQNLVDSREELIRVIEESQETEKSLFELVEMVKRGVENLSNQEIDSLIFSGMSYTIFQSRQGVIDELISSGQVSIIENDYLRMEIASWNGNLISIRETEEMSKSGFYSYADRLGSYFDFSGITPANQMFRTDLKKQFFNDLKTRNTIANNRETSKRLKRAYIEKKQHIETLIQVIDNELNTVDD